MPVPLIVSDVRARMLKAIDAEIKELQDLRAQLLKAQPPPIASVVKASKPASRKMTPKQRKAVSARMKAYWAKRRRAK